MDTSTPPRGRLKLWIIATAIVGCTGAYAVPTHWTEILFASLGARAKLTGKAEPCTWDQVWESGIERQRMMTRFEELKGKVQLDVTDSKMDIQRVSTPYGQYWVRVQGTQLGGTELVAYLLAEHEWMRRLGGYGSVHKGDVVIDAGAHIGVFTKNALAWGAAKVLAIEPDPVNRECLRRNLAEEIAAGRVIIAPVAVWNGPGKMTLHFGVENSGMSSLVEDAGAGGVEVDLATIDSLVQQHQLGRVDFIKMDIEGAEREALKGAAETLRASKPRLMLDSYHRTDDMEVLPQVIRAASADYRIQPGPCEPSVHGLDRFNPHMTFYWQ